MRLRVINNATNEEIQNALRQLFNSSPQGISSNQDPQGHTFSTTIPQGESVSMNDDKPTPSIMSATAISKIQLETTLKNSLHFFLQSEVPYSDILEELSAGTRQVIKNNLIYKRMNSLLVVHDQNQDADLDFWRIIVPDNPEIREHIVRELHSTPYSAHPGIQRTISRVRQSFHWKGMLGDVRQFVENCPVCQMEKSDHTLAKRKLQSTQTPENKWSEITVDFVTDPPLTANNRDTILVTLDKATRMVHLAPCRKNITATGTAQLLWNTVVRYHRVPRVIY